MTWWILLVPAACAAVLCAWRGLPRGLAAGAVCASALLAVAGLARGWVVGVGWPWPLRLALDVPHPDTGAAGWVDLGSWQPRAGLLLDPLSLLTAALAGLALAACALEGARWRVTPDVLARGVALQACLVAAALADDLLLALGALLAGAVCAAWQAGAPLAPGRATLAGLVALAGAAWLAAPAGTTWTALARPGAAPGGALLVLVGLAGLRLARGDAPPRDPATTGVTQGMADAGAALGLTLVLARLWPTWGAAEGARLALGWGGLAAAVLAVGVALRAGTPARAARGAGDATLALVLFAAACDPRAGVRLGWVAALGLPALHLSLAGLARGRPQGARRWSGLGLLLTAPLLAGLPPWAGHQGWSLALGGALQRGPLLAAAGIVVASLLVWALGQLTLAAWSQPGPRTSASEAPWPTLALVGLAVVPAGVWSLAPDPDGVAARLLGLTPESPAAASGLASGLALAALALGAGLAGFARVQRRPWPPLPWLGRWAARGWGALAAAAARADAWASARTRRAGLAAARLWSRSDPLPAPTSPAALADAYRDAALAAAVAVLALALGAWLG